MLRIYVVAIILKCKNDGRAVNIDPIKLLTNKYVTKEHSFSYKTPDKPCICYKICWRYAVSEQKKNRMGESKERK